MADAFFARRVLGSLKPIDAMGEEAIGGIKAGEVVRVEVTRPRNVKHHRKFFALLNVIYPHQTTYPTPEQFRAAITVALGFGESIKLLGGRTIIVPGSISFSKMDQAEFDKFYDRAVELIATKVLPGIDRADVDREVNDILEGNG